MLRSFVDRTVRRVIRAEVAHAASALPEPLQKLLTGKAAGTTDPLDEQQFVITNLNDLQTGAYAEIIDASVGRTAGRGIRNEARARRLHAWRGFVGRFDEKKRGELSAAVTAFETKEVERLGKLTTATEKWRDGLAKKDPHAAPKKKPFYQKYFWPTPPEDEVKKLMAAQMENEGELMTKLQRLGVDIETDVNPLLKGVFLFTVTF